MTHLIGVSTRCKRCCGRAVPKPRNGRSHLEQLERPELVGILAGTGYCLIYAGLLTGTRHSGRYRNDIYNYGLLTTSSTRLVWPTPAFHVHQVHQIHAEGCSHRHCARARGWLSAFYCHFGFVCPKSNFYDFDQVPVSRLGMSSRGTSGKALGTAIGWACLSTWRQTSSSCRGTY
jgi:hypothetical protein